MDFPERKRVVEIEWEGGYGSGYLVAPGVVLTARHVFQAEGKPLPEAGFVCRVRAVGEDRHKRPCWNDAELMWIGEDEHDIAVLHTASRDRTHRPPHFGKSPGDAAEIKCRAIGFPKATGETSAGDDTYQLDGTIRTGTFALSGDLSVDVDSTPPKDPESWPGISGAALFAGEFLVGVIKSYPREFGGEILKAIPLATLANNPGFCAALGQRCPLPFHILKPTTGSLARAASASQFRGTIEAFFEEYLVVETGLTKVPFGGRDADLALLDAWLDDETAPPRYLLTAPAGRGKSALLVRWLQHLQNQGCEEENSSDSWNLVFVPISIRFETHRPDIFYEAIAARLAEILSRNLQPAQADKAVYYSDHCRTLSSVAVTEGRRILIVLDGIDEALGERFDARWFPRKPGTSLRLLVSARWQAGDLDSSGWKTRLGWERDVRVQSRELPVLTREGVGDLLLKMGAPTDVLASRPEITERLYTLAEGEPLVLRYYAEDIWAKGEAARRLTVDDLVQLRPGFGGYFEGWLKDQGRLWEEAKQPIDCARLDAILAILACAHGRLRGPELRSLLTEFGDAAAGGRFLDQLKPIQRFVIGLDRPETETAGYILSHPKLSIYLREERLDSDYIKATRETFVRWGRKTVQSLNRNALQPEDTPVYLLQYHTQHLQDVGVSADAFLELVENGWLRAWEAFEGGYRNFSRDVRLAYEALSKACVADQPRFAQRLRCQLVLSSIYSIGTNTPWELLVAAFKAGVLTYRQVAHWLEFKPSNARLNALATLTPHLPAEKRVEEWFKAFIAARAIEDSKARARALAHLAPHLPAEQRGEAVSEALIAARPIEDSDIRARILAALAPHLTTELLSEALAAARAIEVSDARAEALAALVPHLTTEQRGETLFQALAATQAIKDSNVRARNLAALAPHLPAELLSEALTAARAIEDSDARAVTLATLATHLPSEQRVEAVSEALTAARAIKNNYDRESALARLAPHLPAELLLEALAAAPRNREQLRPRAYPCRSGATSAGGAIIRSAGGGASDRG